MALFCLVFISGVFGTKCCVYVTLRTAKNKWFGFVYRLNMFFLRTEPATSLRAVIRRMFSFAVQRTVLGGVGRGGDLGSNEIVSAIKGLSKGRHSSLTAKGLRSFSAPKLTASFKACLEWNRAQNPNNQTPFIFKQQKFTTIPATAIQPKPNASRTTLITKFHFLITVPPQTRTVPNVRPATTVETA